MLAAAAALLLSAQAHAEPSLAVGIAAPLSGPSAILGRQVEAGARLSAQAFGAHVESADDACTAEGGAAAARHLVEKKVQAVVGFLCTEAIEAAMPILKDAGIPVITVGVRTESLTDRRAKTGWPVYRLAPRGDGEREAVARLLTRLWRDDLFAIVDDGTIYGRELSESFRAAVEQAGLKAVFVDTYRPEMDNQIGLVGRLKKAGATKVFVGGDGSDIAVMERDSQSLDAGIAFAGGETLRSTQGDIPLAAGTLMVAPPEWSEVADAEALDAFRAASVAPDGYALPAYAAVQIMQAASEAGSGAAPELSNRAFETAIGPVRFDKKGDLAESPYRLYRYDGSRFVPTGGD